MQGGGTDPTIRREDEGPADATPPVGEGPLGRWSMIMFGIALLVCVALAVIWTMVQ